MLSASMTKAVFDYTNILYTAPDTFVTTRAGILLLLLTLGFNVNSITFNGLYHNSINLVNSEYVYGCNLKLTYVYRAIVHPTLLPATKQPATMEKSFAGCCFFIDMQTICHSWN